MKTVISVGELMDTFFLPFFAVVFVPSDTKHSCSTRKLIFWSYIGMVLALVVDHDFYREHILVMVEAAEFIREFLVIWADNRIIMSLEVALVTTE